MKKNVINQTVLIAIAALVVGFLFGMVMDFPKPGKDELTGSIGKVDRFRNVQMTEQDILLRNELVEDTTKRAQYEQYLLYYYYQALRTSSDVEHVLAIATAEYEFEKVNFLYSNALTNFKTYLETARTDILTALNIIISIDQNQDVPVVTYLNQAQNAIARIRNNDQVLLNYMNAMATYIESHPEAYLYRFIDAHDILALNVMHSALFTQNKPVLSYLGKKKLLNDKEGIKEVVAETQLKSYIQNQLTLDSQIIGIIRSNDLIHLQTSISAIENLSSIVYSDMSELKSLDQLQLYNSNNDLLNAIGVTDLLSIDFPFII
ncbi:MAG: hypothetical protein Q7V19_17365 [Bacteroidales bacterium]|nr:hypothetical protein [Bacteroidales bacterium]